MSSAVAASAASATSAAAAASPRPAGLDAALAKSQSQLADCVNCASAKTPEGQAKIQALDNQIGAIKAQMERADQTRRDTAAASVQAPASTQRPSLDPIGATIDTYA